MTEDVGIQIAVWIWITATIGCMGTVAYCAARYFIQIAKTKKLEKASVLHRDWV